MNKKFVRNTGIFVFVVIISGWIGVLIDSVLPEQPEGNSLGMGIWLVLPLCGACGISLITWRFYPKQILGQSCRSDSY
jgi:hypothetical protein